MSSILNIVENVFHAWKTRVQLGRKYKEEPKMNVYFLHYESIFSPDVLNIEHGKK